MSATGTPHLGSLNLRRKLDCKAHKWCRKAFMLLPRNQNWPCCLEGRGNLSVSPPSITASNVNHEHHELKHAEDGGIIILSGWWRLYDSRELTGGLELAKQEQIWGKVGGKIKYWTITLWIKTSLIYNVEAETLDLTQALKLGNLTDPNPDTVCALKL